MNNFEKLQDKIGYIFKDRNLLTQALTHLSFANDNNTESYERLEFLGDAVIELVVSDYIFNNFNFDVGTSTKLRASLVSTQYLLEVSKDLGLDKVVRKSKSLQNLSKKNIADLFESVVGAVYIDGGIDSAKKIIYNWIIKSNDNIAFVIKNSIDYKTKLQEVLQSKGIIFSYNLLESSGLDHEKTFKVQLKIDEKIVATEEGKSIQQAEENCAKKYLNSLSVK